MPLYLLKTVLFVACLLMIGGVLYSGAFAVGKVIDAWSTKDMDLFMRFILPAVLFPLMGVGSLRVLFKKEEKDATRSR